MKTSSFATMFAAAMFGLCADNALACNYFSYVNKAGDVVTGRTMDAMNAACEDKMTVRLMPAGMERESNSANPLKWTSKYNSVAEYDYCSCCFDAMNEKGLVCSGLYLACSNYGPIGTRKTLNHSALCQFLVDNFATVEEAVTYLKSEKDNIVLLGILGDLKKSITVQSVGIHYALTDATGESCVIEYLDGEPVFYRRKGVCMALTNDPVYSSHMALLDYYHEKGIALGMPGSGVATDRLVRMYGWMDQMFKEPRKESMEGLIEENSAWQLRVMARSLTRTMTTPHHVDFGEQFQNSSTLWTVNCDPKNGWLYIEHLKSFSGFALEFKKIDFSKGIRELRLYEGKTYAGDVYDQFKPLEGEFAFPYMDVSEPGCNNAETK